MNPMATSKADILKTSRELIRQQGWSSVSIRSVAAACGVSVGWNPAPNLCNSAPYDRFELLRKGAESNPCCQQSYQFCPAGVTSQVHQTGRQFDSHLRN